MKKILLSLILILSLAILCSCNSQNNAIVDDETTVETSNNVTVESTQKEAQTDTSKIENTETEETKEETTEITENTSDVNIEETTENTPSISMKKLVYTNMALSNFVPNDDVEISDIPDDFSFASSVEQKAIEFADESKTLSFDGTKYNIKLYSKTEYNLLSQNNEVLDSKIVSLYKDGDATFNIVDGSGKFVDLMIFKKMTATSSSKKIDINEAETIAVDFMKEYTLATSLEGFKMTVDDNSDYKFYYQMHIGGYEILGEQYVLCMNKSGEVYMYSDDTTGIYDKFVSKVTEEDIMDAEERLYPYIMNGAYGYATPYLKVGNDGNLYLCSAYFVDEEIDGETIAREYMFYSRVYYEE